ncbi:MAG: hypothetical protein WC421_06735 [Elusimicrobiales bacterium]
MLFKKLQQIMKILAVARKPVQLVDDHAVYLAFADDFKKPLHGRAFQALAGLGGVVKHFRIFLPPVCLLNVDVAPAAGFLAVQRCDIVAKVLVVGFARVNRNQLNLFSFRDFVSCHIIILHHEGYSHSRRTSRVL